MLRSAGLDPGALSFAFWPLWQLDAASAAAIALTRAQATQIYAGLKLWPAAVTARLVEAQLSQDGTYPNAAAVFAQDAAASDAVTDALPVEDLSATGFAPWVNEPRDPDGCWTAGGGTSAEPAAPEISDPPLDIPGPHTPDGTPIELAAAAVGLRPSARWSVESSASCGITFPKEKTSKDPPLPRKRRPHRSPDPTKPIQGPRRNSTTRFRITRPADTRSATRSSSSTSPACSTSWSGMPLTTGTAARPRRKRSCPAKMSIGEIQDIVGDVLSHNRDRIIVDQNDFGWDL